MQTVRAMLFIGLFVLLLCSFIILAIAIWPHLPLIGTVASWVIADALICIGLVIPLMAVFFVRWMWHRSSLVSSGPVVVSYAGGALRHLSAEQESAKLIAAPRMTITEEKADGYSPGDLEILAMVSQGKSQSDVAKACNTNQTYVSRLVRRYKEQHNMVD